MRPPPAGKRLLLTLSVIAAAALLFLVRKPHVLEFAHYYMGAKYFSEVGYEGLYEGLTAALSELYGVDAIDSDISRVRRLDGEGFLSTADARRLFAEKSARWSAPRRAAFLEDVRLLDGALSLYSDVPPLTHWRTVLQDHGYNAPPLYTALVSPLANAVPLDGRGLLLLCGIDVLLLAAVFILLAFTFGAGGAAIAFLFFVSSLEPLSYVTWALVRFDWLLAMTAALFFLSRRRFFLSGTLWGVAALLRIFPGVIAAFFLLVWTLASRGGEGRGDRTTFAAGGLAGALGAVLFSSAVLAARAGAAPVPLWREFLRRIGTHAGTGESLNGVGIGKIFEALPLPAAGVLEPLLALALCALLAAALAGRRGPAATTAALAVFCAPLLLYLSHYYYLMLILPAAAGGRPVRAAVAVLCAVNIAAWAAKLGGVDYPLLLNSASLSYSLVLVALPAALYLDGRRREDSPGPEGAP